MRQVGYLAAAAMEALDTADELVTNDHFKAKRLAKGLRELGCLLDDPVSNTILFLPPSKFKKEEFVKTINERGILANIAYSNKIRLIPNINTSIQDIDDTLQIISDIIKINAF